MTSPPADPGTPSPSIAKGLTSSWKIGYCTNVHAGVDLDSIRENLVNHAGSVRSQLEWPTLGVGLWIPASAASQLSGQSKNELEFFDQQGLEPFTINGFPFDNFHGEIVKHEVYRPDWTDPRRLEYTKSLATTLASWISPNEIGSISTLPIGWPSGPLDSVSEKARVAAAAANLLDLVNHLVEIESSTGRRVVIGLEPEPGCLLDRREHVLDLFDRYFDQPQTRRHLGVCHDVCHSAVMMEDQAETLDAYRNADILIAKVQISSAVGVDWQWMGGDRRIEASQRIKQFAEHRYLHQTGRLDRDGQFHLVEDLPGLLESSEEGDVSGGDSKWMIHFHVPIFLERVGQLITSRADVVTCLHWLAKPENVGAFTGHLEVETYAWTVLPADMRRNALAADIASELSWLEKQIESLPRLI
ncbi:MAG: metabolite traffic protein EboE [Planctomycetota bacterium]